MRALHCRCSRENRLCARDVVVANAAFGLYVSGKVENIIDGVAAAEESIDSGRALQKLNHLVDFSRTA